MSGRAALERVLAEVYEGDCMKLAEGVSDFLASKGVLGEVSNENEVVSGLRKKGAAARAAAKEAAAKEAAAKAAGSGGDAGGAEVEEIVSPGVKRQGGAAPAAAKRDSPATSNAVPSAAAAAAPSAGAAEPEKNDKGEIAPNAGNGASTPWGEWFQTLQDVTVNVSVPPGSRSRDLDVVMTRTKIKVARKGQAPVLEGKLHAEIVEDDSFWSVVDGDTVQFTLQKKNDMEWWGQVTEGDGVKIDTQKVAPENSKLSDLDGETRSTVEKMMFDQHAKAAGKPTSDERNKQEMLSKFMAAHPEMDFSQAKIDM